MEPAATTKHNDNMDEIYIGIENSEIFQTMNSLNYNSDGNIVLKIEFEPSVETSNECENIDIKKEICESSELLQIGDSLRLTAPISSDSQPSLKLINNKIIKKICLKKSLLKTEDPKKKHKKRFICDVCHKTFANKNRIKVHIRKFHGAIKCIFCPQTFPREKLQERHILFHHMEKKIICSLCPMKFSCVKYLNRHMHQHENDKLAALSKTSKNIPVYKCKICQRNYYDIFIFKRHLGVHRYRPVKKVFKCDVCDENFTHSRYLISHKRVHDDDTPSFDCDICKKKFAWKTSLTRHIESHSDRRKYVCQLCPKSYKLSKGLTRHMYKHNSHRQNIKNTYVMNSLGKYDCPECKNVLSTSGTLRRHLLSIHGDKKHACPFCGKEFSRKEVLVTHIRVHTGEKPFSCSKCSKKFIHLGNKASHEKKKH